MRILHVIASLGTRHGGPAAVLPDMCNALAARGHELEIMTTNRDGDYELDVPTEAPVDVDGVKVTYFPVQRPRWYLTSVPMARALRSRVAEFDVGHIHGLYRFHTLATGHFCRRFAVPYVIRPHGTLNPYHRGVRRARKAIFDRLIGWRNLNAAAAVHYTSEAERAFAEEAGVRTKGFVIPHGLTVEDNGSAGAVAATHGDGAQTVLFLGRLTEKKGLDVLCEAFARVADARPETRLVIAGPDDEGVGDWVKRFVDSQRLSHRVVLAGPVVGEAKRALFREASVFALPSRDESFAVAAGEAAAAGVPVVITPHVAIHEDVARASAGLVVPRTPDAFAEAIGRLLDDPALRARMGANGRMLVRETYSWAKVARRLEEMYLAAIAAPR